MGKEERRAAGGKVRIAESHGVAIGNRENLRLDSSFVSFPCTLIGCAEWRGIFLYCGRCGWRFCLPEERHSFVIGEAGAICCGERGSSFGLFSLA